jgi:hypothetical protein
VNSIRRDEIAARQRHASPSIDVIEMFVHMKDQA